MKYMFLINGFLQINYSCCSTSLHINGCENYYSQCQDTLQQLLAKVIVIKVFEGLSTMGSGASTVYDKSVVDEMRKHVDSDVVILGEKDTTDSKVSFKIVTTCFGLLF